MRNEMPYQEIECVLSESIAPSNSMTLENMSKDALIQICYNLMSECDYLHAKMNNDYSVLKFYETCEEDFV